MLATYEIVCSKYADAETGTAVKAFLQSTIGGGQDGLADNGYIPIPDTFKSKADHRDQRHRLMRDGPHRPGPRSDRRLVAAGGRGPGADRKVTAMAEVTDVGADGHRRARSATPCSSGSPPRRAC